MTKRHTFPHRSLALGAGLSGILFAGTLQAATVTLIGSSIRNGGFEEATLSGSPAEANFNDTPNWVNLGGAQGDQAVRDNIVRTGSVRGVVVGTRTFGNDTGHTLLTGDTVNFSYWWRDAFQWDSAVGEMQFTVFTTDDDTISGTVDQSQSWLSGLSTNDGTYQEHSDSFTATAPWDNKRLFVSLKGVDGQNGGVPAGFAGIDDVFVEVVTIPEPSTALLGGLGLLALLRRRR